MALDFSNKCITILGNSKYNNRCNIIVGNSEYSSNTTQNVKSNYKLADLKCDP